MNEKILEQLLPIVEKTKEGLLRGIEILQEQAPELIRQLLAWELAVGYVGAVVSIIVIFFFAFCFWLGLENNEDSVGLIGMIGTILSFSVLVVNIMKIVQISVAPNIFLLKYFSDLIS